MIADRQRKTISYRPPSPTERFAAFIRREVAINNERGDMSDYRMYEYLKRRIDHYGVSHEIGCKLISKALGI